MLTSILDPKFKPEDQLMLEEKETDTHSAMIVEIKNLTAYKHALYRFDPNECVIFPYFNTVTGLQKICDYFIFVQKQEKKTVYIFVIELKRIVKIAKNSKPKKQAENQLEASMVFADFLKKSAQRIYPDLINPIKIVPIAIHLKEKRKNGNSPLEFNGKRHLIYNRSVLTWNTIIKVIEGENEAW